MTLSYLSTDNVGMGHFVRKVRCTSFLAGPIYKLFKYIISFDLSCI